MNNENIKHFMKYTGDNKPFNDRPVPDKTERTPINDNYFDILVNKYGKNIVDLYFVPLGLRG